MSVFLISILKIRKIYVYFLILSGDIENRQPLVFVVGVTLLRVET